MAGTANAPGAACRRRPGGTYALADGPDLRARAARRQGLERVVDDHVVEAADQALVGPEHHRADCPPAAGAAAPAAGAGGASPKAGPQAELDGARVVAQRGHRFSYWPMLAAACAFIARTTDCRSPALSILRRRLGRAVAIRVAGLSRAAAVTQAPGAAGSSIRLGQERRKRRVPARPSPRGPRRSACRTRSRRSPSASGMSRPAASTTACSASAMRSSGTGSNSPAVRASRIAICAGTGTGASSGCFRQARMRWPCVIDGLRVVVEAGAEAGEGLELLELRIGQLEVAGHGAEGRQLRLAADARDRPADVHRRQHAELEQRGRQVDLAVGDRDQVGRDVGRDVLGLGLDDRQRRQRAAAALLRSDAWRAPAAANGYRRCRPGRPRAPAAGRSSSDSSRYERACCVRSS